MTQATYEAYQAALLAFAAGGFAALVLWFAVIRPLAAWIVKLCIK